MICGDFFFLRVDNSDTRSLNEASFRLDDV